MSIGNNAKQWICCLPLRSPSKCLTRVSSCVLGPHCHMHWQSHSGTRQLRQVCWEKTYLLTHLIVISEYCEQSKNTPMHLCGVPGLGEHNIYVEKILASTLVNLTLSMVFACAFAFFSVWAEKRILSYVLYPHYACSNMLTTWGYQVHGLPCVLFPDLSPRRVIYHQLVYFQTD